MRFCFSRSNRYKDRYSRFFFLFFVSSVGYFSNYIDHYKVAIVCSARSSSTKALGTTNLLLRATTEVIRRPKKSTSIHSPGNSDSSQPASPRPRSGSAPQSPSPQGFRPFPCHPSESAPEFVATVDLLREEHLSAARDSVRDPEILKELELEIERDCDWLCNFLFATKVCFSVR